MKSKSFTLIELLVVISIISLLASVVLASLNTAREKGRMGGAKYFATQVDHIGGEQAVGLWDFNDCATTNASDRSGFASTAILSTSALWQAGDTPSGVGCSIVFDGTTQAINVSGPNAGTIFDFGATIDFTLAVWVKTTNVSNGPFVIDKRSTFGGTAAGYSMRLDNPTGRPCLRMGDNVNVYDFCPSSGFYADGKWHHLVISVDRAASAVFYGDGQQIGTASMAGVGNLDRPAITLHFGTKDGTSSNAVNGLVDDIHIFAKKLSAGEVRTLYTAGQSKTVVYNE